MKYIQRLLLFAFIVFSFASCIEEPEFKDVSNFKIDEINQNQVCFNADVSVYNPNGVSLKIRKSVFDVYADDIYVGKAHLLSKYKMKRKQLNTNNVPVKIVLEKGVFLRLLGFLRKDKVELRLKGILKGSAVIIPFRRKIDQKEQISLDDLNINLKGLFN